MTTVTHPKFGKGQIISQDENNVTVDFDGAIKTLVIKYCNLSIEDGTPFFQAPASIEKKIYTSKKSTTRALVVETPKTDLEKMIEAILTINNLSKYNQSNSGEILSRKAQDIITQIQIKAGGKGLQHLRNSKVIETNANDFVGSVADSVMKFGRCSIKQASILAQYAIDNNITIA